ncbi:PaaI family thioesterase [Amylibacter sp. IMCC11727]|uniref:PaaI family thioesterase n=1 Tax=Amylibacter sp. IMCC11727 TaxID=3039851 RepID=UPI00244DA569|nr:PaaI family thioesterase [Amylibacter sp. IMCC11727]WGI23197.1 PaaI family thioesterase [Amylibacter sp. IMCC11727]
MTDTKDLLEDPYEYQKLIGFDIVEWEQDHAKLHLQLATKHGNRYGIPHGGIHATLLDTCMGFAGCYTGDRETPQLAMTLSLTVQYLSRPKGTLLIATGRKTGGGRKTFFAEGDITDDTGELIAKGTGTFRYRS